MSQLCVSNSVQILRMGAAVLCIILFKVGTLVFSTSD